MPRLFEARRGYQLEEAHRNRDKLMKLAASKLKDIDAEVWQRLDFYYDEVRNDLYHESAAKTLTEEAISDYEETVYFVLDRALSARLGDLVEREFTAAAAEASTGADGAASVEIDWSRLSSKVEHVLAAISVLSPRTVEEVNALFKKEGVGLRLAGAEFTNIVARNSGSKSFFYYDKETKRWLASGTGKFKLGTLLRKDNG